MTLSKYGEFQEFNDTFNPRKASRYVQTIGVDRMITSEYAPTLTIVNHLYGRENTMSFLVSHIFDLALYFGNAKSTEMQMYSIAEVLYDLGYYLKVTEWMLFFHMVKLGRFRDNKGDDRAKMYGNFNGEAITDCFYAFRSWRNDELGRIEARQHQEAKSSEIVANPEQIKSAMEVLVNRWKTE